jgi:hypothetical protein
VFKRSELNEDYDDSSTDSESDMSSKISKNLTYDEFYQKTFVVFKKMHPKYSKVLINKHIKEQWNSLQSKN